LFLPVDTLKGLSKTVKTNIYHCNSESMRKPVDCYSEDVVNTYKTLTAHWPIFCLKELAMYADCVQPFFLTPKSRPKLTNEVWFLKTPVGKNTLGQTVKNIILATPEIKANGRIFSNKTPRRIGISRMEEAEVPIDKGMRITGHR
jgi:hypothetical protein